jgi:hypothetical protein
MRVRPDGGSEARSPQADSNRQRYQLHVARMHARLDATATLLAERKRAVRDPQRGGEA